MKKFLSLKNGLGLVTLLVGNILSLARAFGVNIPLTVDPILGQTLATAMGLYLVLADRGDALDTPVPMPDVSSASEDVVMRGQGLVGLGQVLQVPSASEDAEKKRGIKILSDSLLADPGAAYPPGEQNRSEYTPAGLQSGK